MYGKFVAVVCFVFFCHSVVLAQDVQSQIESVEQKIASEKQAQQAAEQNVAKEHKTLMDATAQLTALKTQRSTAEQELTQKTSGVTVAEAEVAKAEEEVTAARAALDASKREHNQTKIPRNNVIVLHSAVVKVEAEVQTGKIDTPEGVARYNTATGENIPIATPQSEFVQLLQKKIVDLAQELETKEKDADAKGAIVRQKEDALQNAEKALSDARNAMDAARAVRSTAEKEVTRLSDEVTNAESLINMQLTNVASAQKEAERHSAQLAKLQQKAVLLRQVAESAAELKVAKADIAAAHSASSQKEKDLQTQIDFLKAELATKASAVDLQALAAKVEAKADKTAVDALEKRMDALEHHIATMPLPLNVAVEVAKQLNIAQLQKKLQQHEDALATLKAAHTAATVRRAPAPVRGTYRVQTYTRCVGGNCRTFYTTRPF